MRAQAPQIAPVGTADAELVRRARGRDEAAIRLILQSNNRRLYRIARGILRNDSEAEDVVQETYVRAFTHLENFRGDSSLATWLARIAMNEALGRLRRQRPGVEWTSLPRGTLEAQIIQFPLSATSVDPEKSMAQREIQHVVEHAIDELPDAFRIVFITRVIRGNRRDSRTEAGDRENATASRPHHSARQGREDNRPRGDGDVSVCRQALRTPPDAVLKRLGFSA
jgi:RNA polymerase sigma-70 factor (ECF subfamily)